MLEEKDVEAVGIFMEYREQGNKRKIELSIKDPKQDQNCKPNWKRRCKKKPIKVFAKQLSIMPGVNRVWCFGHYENREGAEQAVAQRMSDPIWKKYYEMWIE